MAAVTFAYRSTKPVAFLEVRFSFRENKSDQPISYYARSRIEVSHEFWKDYSKKKNFKDIEKRNFKDEVNLECIKLRNFILDEFHNVPETSKEWFKNVVDKFYNPTLNTSQAPTTLLEYFDFYLDNNKHITPGTRKKIRTIKNRIQNNLKPNSIPFSEIDDSFRNRLYESLSNYDKNTIEYTIKQIKTICNHARKKGIEINPDVNDWEIRLIPSPIIYLNENELSLIKELENLTESLDNARDWLLISCFTGQRISDFMRFEKSMIRKQKNVHGKQIPLIEFTQVKTLSKITLPLHDEVLRILEKRNGEFPRPISDVKYNKYIKQVCKLAEIDQLVKGSKKVETAKGSKIYRKVTDKYPKYELITSHTGRRSFATNNFGKIPTRLIMSATGHSKEDIFLKYIGKTQTEQALNLADYF